MKITEQVTNLELSKRLKELGVGQDGLFEWENRVWKKSLTQEILEMRWVVTLISSDNDTERCSAFTVAELGEMLGKNYLYFTKFFDNGNVTFGGREIEPFIADNEANVRAKMLIHLIETGVVKV